MPQSKWPEVQQRLLQIEEWCRDGALDQDIADKLGIALSTLNDYKRKHPELEATIQRGKGTADSAVVASLYKQATGFHVKEIKAFKCREIYYDDSGRRCEKETVQTAEVENYIAPDTTAIAIWLNNRMPSQWRRNAGKEQLDRERFEHDKQMDEKRDW